MIPIRFLKIVKELLSILPLATLEDSELPICYNLLGIALEK